MLYTYAHMWYTVFPWASTHSRESMCSLHVHSPNMCKNNTLLCTFPDNFNCGTHIHLTRAVYMCVVSAAVCTVYVYYAIVILTTVKTFQFSTLHGLAGLRK